MGDEFAKALFYYFDKYNNNLSALKQCIEEGDGTTLILPSRAITYVGMEAHKMETVIEKMSGFSYNPALFPPYGETDGYWFLFFRYNADSDSGRDFNFSMVSLITEYQQDVLTYFDFCILGNLVFVPSFDTRLLQTDKPLNKGYIIGRK